MKQKIIAMIMIMVCMINIGGNDMSVHAEEGQEIDYSFLQTEEALVDYMVVQTRGIYLMDGNSIISKMGPYTIGAGGSTSATRKCKISITCIVERRLSTGWERVTSWTKTKENDFEVMISRSLDVATNHYYRVRSIHYAASDTTSTCTGALSM